MIRKRKLIIFVSLALFFVLLVGYIAVIAPMLEDPEEEKKPLDTVDSLESEGVNGRYLMFPHLERADIESIKVTNADGTFEFCRDRYDDFIIKGHETALYDETLFAQLVVSIGYAIAKEKICDNATAEQFAQYGLDVPQARWTVESKNGDKYTVEVGSELVTGAGYYCRFVGRDSIYILDSSLGKTVLAPVESFVSPTLVVGVTSSNYYTIDNFTLFRGEDIYFAVRIKAKSEQTNPDAQLEYEMLYPMGYDTHSTNYGNLLATMQDLKGFATVKLGPTEEDIKKYGLEAPAYTVSFEIDGVEIMIFVSEKQEDGTYYAMSSLFPETLIVVEGETFAFLETENFKWISSYIFSSTITYVDKISVKSERSDIVFDLHHSTSPDEQPVLDVTTNVGKDIPDANIYNFRQLYKVLLSVQMFGYAPYTEDEVKDMVANDEPYMTITYEMTSGKKTTYRFYDYSSRRSLVTINGTGQFYIYTDILDKIDNDIGRVLRDEVIDPFGKN